MNRRKYLFVTFAVSAGVLALAATSISASAESPGKPNDGELRSTATSAESPITQQPIEEYGVAAFSNPQRPQDTIPEIHDPGALSPNGLSAESSRYMGSSADVDYWLALDSGGLICLVAATKTMAGAGCFTPDRFAEGGANVRLEDREFSIEAYAVNDLAANSQSLKSSSMTAIGSNAFVLDASLASKIQTEFGDKDSPLKLFPARDSVEGMETSR